MDSFESVLLDYLEQIVDEEKHTNEEVGGQILDELKTLNENVEAMMVLLQNMV